MLSSCMEHILTKDALYLLSYISMPRTGNDDIIHNLPWFGKGEFAFFLKRKSRSRKNVTNPCRP